MINLLPPHLKEEIAYSKRNALMRRYVVVALVLAVVLVGGLLGGRYYLNRQVANTNAAIAVKQRQIAQYAGLANQASTLGERLTAIGAIQKNQAKFSELLSNLAAVMPQGTAISSLTLTGNDKQPVQLTVAATNYANALAFRDSIIASKRISAADIESITPGAVAGTYNVIVTFAFNPGEAK